MRVPARGGSGSDRRSGVEWAGGRHGRSGGSRTRFSIEELAQLHADFDAEARPYRCDERLRHTHCPSDRTRCAAQARQNVRAAGGSRKSGMLAAGGSMKVQARAVSSGLLGGGCAPAPPTAATSTVATATIVTTRLPRHQVHQAGG